MMVSLALVLCAFPSTVGDSVKEKGVIIFQINVNGLSNAKLTTIEHLAYNEMTIAFILKTHIRTTFKIKHTRLRTSGIHSW